MGDVVSEHILVGIGCKLLAVLVIEPVKSAGENQKGTSVGADCGFDCLADGVTWEIPQAGIEFGEHSALWSLRGDELT